LAEVELPERYNYLFNYIANVKIIKSNHMLATINFQTLYENSLAIVPETISATNIFQLNRLGSVLISLLST